MGLTTIFQHMMLLLLLLTCDDALKFDWIYQLPGSGSKSLKSIFLLPVKMLLFRLTRLG